MRQELAPVADEAVTAIEREAPALALVHSAAGSGADHLSVALMTAGFVIGVLIVVETLVDAVV